MTLWKPDPTFYPSPRLAMQGPPEKLAYVVAFNPNKDGRTDLMTVVDVAPDSQSSGKIVGRVEMPQAGDELHHFGWNACSSALCPYAPHPHVERRYLITPGLRSSRIHILDTKPDPRQPQIVKVIEPEDVFTRARYSRFHTIHCGPEGIYVSALGSPSGDGPGASFSSTISPSTCLASGRSIAGRNTCPTISGGISVTTRWSPVSGARRT